MYNAAIAGDTDRTQFAGGLAGWLAAGASFSTSANPRGR